MTGPTDIEIERAVEALNNNHWHIVADMMLALKRRAEAAEKRVKELEPIVTMREQELMGELVRERGLVQVSHKRESAMRDLLMRFIPADRHDEVRAALEAKP